MAAAAAAVAVAALADPRMAPHIWKAFAGPLARLPSTGAKVYYFPKGHADQCRGVDLPHVLTDTAFPCTVNSVQMLYHQISDAPYALISLLPGEGLAQPPAAAAPHHEPPLPYALHYYVRQLEGTSDYQAFSVPKACAEEFFPPLGEDQVQVQGQPKPHAPNQYLNMADVHGHPVGRNSRLRHLRSNNQHKLTVGWREYFQEKKLEMGKGEDGVVIMRCAQGEGGLIMGFRRGKPSKDLAQQLVDDVVAGNRAAGAVPSSDLTLNIAPAAPQVPFTVQYNPRQGWPFVVPRKDVDDARNIDWQAGNKVRMAIPKDEHELPASRLDAKTPDFFHGTITAVDNSTHWCKLQVEWAESPIPSPNSYVNTWQVKLVEPRKRKPSDAPSSSRTEPSKMPRHDIT